MSPFNYVSAIVCQTAFFCTFCLPVMASLEGQWQGKGRIVSGSGSGASVNLQVEINDNNVKSTIGPALRGTIEADGSVNSANGIWYFERCNDDLCVDFHQNNPHKRLIRYRIRK